MRVAALMLAALLLGVAAWLFYANYLGGDVVDITSVPAKQAGVVVPTSTTITTIQSTTTTVRPDVPDQEADISVEVAVPWGTNALTEAIVAPTVGIDAPVDTFGWEGTNSCGSLKSPCTDRVNNFINPDVGLVSACQTGVSLFSGHSVGPNGRDSFSDIFDDEEFEWDRGLDDGDIIIAPLTDGSTCIGTVRDFTVGPGEAVEGNKTSATVRFWLKSDLGRGVTRELVKQFDTGSYGVLLASYCHQCRFPEDFIQRSDGKWHRLYNVAVLVEWVEIQPRNQLQGGVMR